MAAQANGRAAAGHRPLSRGRGRRAAMALLGLHEQDLISGRPEYFDRFRHRRRIDPIFRIHEKATAGFDGGAGLVHLLQDVLVHERFRYVLTNGNLLVAAPEIPVNGLLEDVGFSALKAASVLLRVRPGWLVIVTYVHSL